MRIANNILALNAFNSLAQTGSALQETIRALSTGLRINSASDDAAGFAVSEKMRSQIRGLDVALRNSQDGISLLQTAEGALSQTNGMLQRMRDLSIQASNASLTSNDRQYIQLEIDQLKDEINRIAGTTQFNKKRILDGSSGALWASSDSGVRVRINGGLTYTDKFGQKVSSEGNYRIEVKAEPGQAQVQKSNIMNVMDITTKTGTTEKDYVIDLSKSLDNSETPASSGDGWEFTTDDDGNAYLRIFADGTFNLTGTAPAGMYIDVEGTASNAVVFLSDVSIDNSGEGLPAFYIEEGAKVDIYLSGNNTLKSGEYYAGICVLPGAELTISSSSGDFSTSGTLNVTGGSGGAGIGGSSIADENDIGTITINGGTIVAEGGESVAGIGCSYDGRNGNIIINGGSITAQGGSFTDENPRLLPSGQIEFYVRAGAGIGSGSRTDDSNNSINNMNITITGGTVNAYGGTSDAEHNGTEYKIGAAGIGGGTVIDSGHKDWSGRECFCQCREYYC